jgi:hypothetical protein
MTFKCIGCGVEKVRQVIGHRERGKRIFGDENRRIWNGHTCYECTKKKSLAKSRERTELRAKDKAARNAVILVETKLRPCRKCGVQNHNYFYCPSCYAAKRDKNVIAFSAAEMMDIQGGTAFV